jgi:hypothetical protein
MQIYAVSFKAVAVSVQQDLIELVAAAGLPIRILGIVLSQTTDHGDAAAEGLQLSLIRGHTTSGSVGSSFVPLGVTGQEPASGATCEINNTTIATGGTAQEIYTDGWNIQAGHQIWWTPKTAPGILGSGRIVLRQSAPADVITQSGTLYYCEGGGEG